MSRLTVSLLLLVTLSVVLVGCGNAGTYAKNYDEENGNVVSLAMMNGNDATGYIIGNGRMEIKGHVISMAAGNVKVDDGEVMKVVAGDRVDVSATKGSLTISSGAQHVVRSL